MLDFGHNFICSFENQTMDLDNIDSGLNLLFDSSDKECSVDSFLSQDISYWHFIFSKHFA